MVEGQTKQESLPKITKPTGVTWENLRILPCIPNKGIKHKGKL